MAPSLSNAIACLKVDTIGRGGIDLSPSLSKLELPVAKALGDGLLAVYLVDAGTHFAYVTHRDLADAKLTADALHEIGLDNLSARCEGGKLRVHEFGTGYGVLLDGHFEASLLLLDELWDEAFQAQTPNGAVVTIPARDILAFCDAKSEDGIAELRAIASRLPPTASHQLTKTLYRRVNGRWTAMAA